eukprot:Phypoly_transcript_08420.p1 GENE.Phypoly_transcript_08420~~Phypoly_transcript_08420.p1  ORF type:complete len:381 (+),score=49.02 Phypoly_transcript_08420:167-1309(+)
MRTSVEDALRGINSKARHTLDLCYYKLDDEGARKIAQFLHSDKFVKRLNLSWNEIWPDGARVLAHSLVNNSTLEFLDLSHNSIQTEGAEQLAWALKSNKTLKCLTLSDNNITDEGIKSLLAALEANTTLVKLEIEGNPIFDRDLKNQIRDRLYSNSLKKTEKNQSTATVVAPDPNLAKELEEIRVQNKNLKKSLEKLKHEHGALKNQFKAHDGAQQDVAAQLDASIQERKVLEKSIIDLSIKLEREKAKTVELAELEKQREALRKETQEARDHATALTAERRTLRTQNERLTKQVALLTANADYETVDLTELGELEEQLEATTRAVRKIKALRLQRKLDEALDARKCKICFENSVNSVLMPCMHHILCEVSLIKLGSLSN